MSLRAARVSLRYLSTMAVNKALPAGLKDDLFRTHERRNPVQPSPSSPSTLTLPQGFLEGPAPNLTKSKVDTKKAGILENEKAWAVILDGVLSEDEAMVNVGGGMQAMYEDTRKCGRIIWDNKDIMAKLWARIEASVPEIHRLQDWAFVTGNGPAKRGETWKVTRLNERGRYLKYIGGEYFKPHCHGSYETPDRTERSYFTLHLYLNDAVRKNGEKPLQGGATTFFNGRMTHRIDVVPKSGRVLLFQHRYLIHSGDDVVKGIKFTLRTDIMYALEKDVASEAEE